MDSIFTFSDYREYLQAFVSRRKEQARSFSVRGFLQRAGIGSPSFLNQVIGGKRNLTELTISRLCKAMPLSGPEAEYFRALVHFCQSHTSEEKQLHYQRMREVAGAAKVKTVGEASYGYYEKWYIPVLRELLCMHPQPENYAEIARLLSPPVPVSEVKQAARRLVELGFLTRQENGTYRQTDPLLSTGFAVQSMAIRQFNKQMVELAAESLDQVPVTERNITGVTMALSPESYRQITEEIRSLQDRILALAEKEDQANRVYQMNVMLFPVSKPLES